MERFRSVHRALAQSYLSYYLFSVIGLFADVLYPVRLFAPEHSYLAIVFFVLGPLLIVWAQYTSFLFEKRKQETGHPQFKRGPYRFIRNPTQMGLLLLVTGYALATGAVMLFVATVLAYLCSNIFFYKHEHILEERYGSEYQTYKQEVKKIL